MVLQNFIKNSNSIARKSFIFCWLLIIAQSFKGQNQHTDSVNKEIVALEYRIFKKAEPKFILLQKKADLYTQINDYKHAILSLERIKTNTLNDSIQFIVYQQLSFFTFIHKEYAKSLKYIKNALQIKPDVKLTELETICLIELKRYDEISKKHPELLDSRTNTMLLKTNSETTLKWYYYVFPGIGMMEQNNKIAGMYGILLETSFLTSIVFHSIYFYPASILVLGVYPFLKFYLGGLDNIHQSREKKWIKHEKEVKKELFKKLLLPSLK